MDPLLQHLKGENLNVRSMPTVTDTIQPYHSEKIWEISESAFHIKPMSIILLLLNVDSELIVSWKSQTYCSDVDSSYTLCTLPLPSNTSPY